MGCGQEARPGVARLAGRQQRSQLSGSKATAVEVGRVGSARALASHAPLASRGSTPSARTRAALLVCAALAPAELAFCRQRAQGSVRQTPPVRRTTLAKTAHQLQKAWLEHHRPR